MSPAVGAIDRMEPSDPHAMSVPDVMALLGVDRARGLSGSEVEIRRGRHGANQVDPVARPSLGSIVWDAISEPFVVLLFAAGVLAVLLGEVRDGALVLVGLLPIVGADVVTTYRSERALESLRAAAAPIARVRRGGAIDDIPRRTSSRATSCSFAEAKSSPPTCGSSTPIAS